MRLKARIQPPRGSNRRWSYTVSVGSYPFITTYRGDGETIEEARAAAIERLVSERPDAAAYKGRKD